MPSRQLLGRIIDGYFSDDAEARAKAFRIFTEDNSAEFGAFLREHIFEPDEDADNEEMHAHTGSSAA